MVDAQLQTLKSLLDSVDAQMDPAVALECKHFFSGAAAYADGRIFMTLTPVGLALKLPEEARNSLLSQGAKPLKYFPKAPIKKDYVVLPEAMVADRAGLATWISESARFALTFSRPRKRR